MKLCEEIAIQPQFFK